MNYDTTPTPTYKQMANSNNPKDMYYSNNKNNSTNAGSDSFSANARPNMTSPSIEHIDEELQQRQ